jgi:hypothetical protein
MARADFTETLRDIHAAGLLVLSSQTDFLTLQSVSILKFLEWEWRQDGGTVECKQTPASGSGDRVAVALPNAGL